MSTDVDVATVTDFKSSYDNTTFGVSAEVGYRWDISKTFYLTPQAELSYGLVKGADYTAANEIRVDQDDFQTLVGRLGFQAGMNVADGAGSVYLTASVNHDFQGESDAYARRGDSAEALRRPGRHVGFLRLRRPDQREGQLVLLWFSHPRQWIGLPGKLPLLRRHPLLLVTEQA